MADQLRWTSHACTQATEHRQHDRGWWLRHSCEEQAGSLQGQLASGAARGDSRQVALEVGHRAWPPGAAVFLPLGPLC